MKYQNILFTLMFSLSLVLTAGCQRNQSQSPGLSARALSMTATASPTEDVVNPAFIVTADQVRKTFDEAELRGEKKQGISVGEEKSVIVSAKDQMGKVETLNLSILFLTPLEQARAVGYSFGRDTKVKTAEARKEIEDRAISTITANSNEVTFRVSLQQPKNDDDAIPSITFRVIDKEGARIGPMLEPSSFVASGKDLQGTVELAQEGEKLTFPLFAGASPNLTAKMQKMSLIVKIGGKEQSLEYALK